MNEHVPLSMIIPVYNGGRYLRECLDSLAMQRLSEVEYIVIDDGSTDDSFNIAKEYELADSRFRVITKPNSGYGSTMNMGLAMARGEYLGVLESDDYLESDALVSLLALANSFDSPDIVKANHYRFTENGDERFVENYPYDICGRLLSPMGIEGRYLILSIPAIWAAIYRTEFLKTNMINFLESPGASFQDTGFVFKAWAAAKTVIVTHEAFLHYRFGNTGSSTMSRGKIFCVCDEWASIDRFASQDMERYEALAPIFAAKKYQTYKWNLIRVGDSFKHAFVMRAHKDLKQEWVAGHFEQALYSQDDWRKLNIWIDNPDMLLMEMFPCSANSTWQSRILSRFRKLKGILKRG